MSISKRIKSWKNRVVCWWLYRVQYKLKKFFHPRAAFFVLSCDHSNLGDHAIAFAAKRILDEVHINYIEVPSTHLYATTRNDNCRIYNKRPIFINGGGNLGTLWPLVEQSMRNVVKNNPESSIAILPNSIFYEDSEYGREELERSKEIYNAHNDLKMYAREQISYSFMKDVYRDVSLVPDLVLSLDRSDLGYEREGCILCLRSDLEKTMSDEESDVIEKQAAAMFGENIARLDTVKEYAVGVNERENELDKIFKEFASAELVITDRLHGMIFAAITGTPCIVINSRSPKVKGCYEWIKDLGYIRFCDDITKLEEVYRSIPGGAHKYDNSHLQSYFDNLKKDIIDSAKRK